MARPLRAQGRLARAFLDRLTPRGRFLFWAALALAILGLNTRANQVYIVFAPAAALFAVASALGHYWRPAATLTARWPERATAGAPVSIPIAIRSTSRRALTDLWLFLPPPTIAGPGGLVSVEPEDGVFPLPLDPGATTEATIVLRPEARGRYILAPALARTDPLRIAASRSIAAPEHALLVVPRFFHLDGFDIPAGRRYQPGGIPLASNTGESLEFLGTREWRDGDSPRAIHWRSWARRGKPVVKEYQEEYFVRIALILDTFVPARAKAPELRSFEAAISVLASIADFYSRSDYVVDILAAGPELYDVSAGRSLAYLDNILDVLACLEPCREPPFEKVGPPLFDRLQRITTVVAVLQDWDPAREDLLRRVRALGTAVRVLIVREGETTVPWARAAEDVGVIEAMAPSDVERRLTAANEPSSRGPA